MFLHEFTLAVANIMHVAEYTIFISVYIRIPLGNYQIESIHFGVTEHFKI